MFNSILRFNSFSMQTLVALRERLRHKLSAKECVVKSVDKTCGAFLKIRVSSPLFENRPLLAQHRMVTDVINELGLKLHGYNIETIIPRP